MQRLLSREAQRRQASVVRLGLAGVPGPPCSRVVRRLAPPTAHLHHHYHHHHRWLSSDSGGKAAPDARAKDEACRPSVDARQQPEEGAPPPHHSPISAPGSQEEEAAGKPRDVCKVDPPPPHDTTVGLYQRFKRTFQQYGKVMIPVHIATSSVWVGVFYYAAMK